MKLDLSPLLEEFLRGIQVDGKSINIRILYEFSEQVNNTRFYELGGANVSNQGYTAGRITDPSEVIVEFACAKRVTLTPETERNIQLPCRAGKFKVNLTVSSVPPVMHEMKQGKSIVAPKKSLFRSISSMSTSVMA